MKRSATLSARALLALPSTLFVLAATAAAVPQRGIFEPPFTAPIEETTAPLEILDSIEGTNVDFVYPAIDPMVMRRPQGQLFVANCHNGEIARFSTMSPSPDLVIDAPLGVMGLALWKSAIDDYEELIALSRGNYGLTFYDPDTGDMTDWLALPDEPADMLVMNGLLFVSCAADSVVLQIDLETRSIVHTYSLTGAIAYSRLFAHDGLVYVTAQHSGNNSIVLRGQGIGAGGQVTPLNEHILTEGPIPILDGTNPIVSSTGGLPDEDVMCIDPVAQTVDVAVEHAGTTLGAARVHPGDDRVWILNMEANNKDPQAQSEPLINGNFVFNRITRTTLGGNGSPPTVASGSDFISLDDLSAAGAPGEAVGHPYDLDFHNDGTAFVIGLLTDNVVQLDASGAIQQRWNLPAGSIPRDIMVVENANRVLVYCWGTNKVAVIDLVSGQVLPTQLDVGHDPTPEIRKEGREIFYDGHNSLKGNASCESCHIEGGMDFVAWDLSNLPFDDKGPLTTQNLKNIEPLNPYHWRGERAGLIDFNVAFSGLLGGTELSPEDFAKFEAFVFGMHEPANPRTSLERVVVASGAEVQENFNVKGDTLHAGLSAINGQDVYLTKPNVGVSTCQDCHALPTGTVNEFFHDGIIDQDHRSSFDVPAYNGLWRKEQKSRFTIDVAGTPEVRPPLGVGTAHSGFLAGVYEFVTEQFPPLTVNERQDVALFLHQIDSGVGPAVHRAALLSQAHAQAGEFIAFLIDQAEAGNCDLGAFGSVTTNGNTRRLRWWFDPEISRFVCEDSSEPNRLFRYFAIKAEAGEATVMFFGLPRAMGRPFTIDSDDDGLRNLDEAGFGTSPTDPDSDGDGFFDGVEVAYGSVPTVPDVPNDTDDPQITRFELIYKTARVAKYIVETDEPCTLTAGYDIAGTIVNDAVTIDDYGRHFVVHLRELEPSYSTDMVVTDVTVTVEVTDQSNNSTQATAPTFVTDDFILATEQTDMMDPIDETIVKQLGIPVVTVEGSDYRIQCDVLIHHQKRSTNVELPNQSLIARILVKPNGASEFVHTVEENLEMDGFPAPIGPQPAMMAFLNTTFGLPFPGPEFLYLGLGPFVASPATDPNGVATLEFVLKNAPSVPGSPMIGPGAEVVINVESVLEVDPLDWPTTLSGTDRAYHFPATPVEARATQPVTLP